DVPRARGRRPGRPRREQQTDRAPAVDLDQDRQDAPDEHLQEAGALDAIAARPSPGTPAGLSAEGPIDLSPIVRRGTIVGKLTGWSGAREPSRSPSSRQTSCGSAATRSSLGPGAMVSRAVALVSQTRPVSFVATGPGCSCSMPWRPRFKRSAFSPA